MPQNKYPRNCALVSSLTSLLLGYGFGRMNGSVVHAHELKTPDTHDEVLAAILSFLSVIGPLVAGCMSDRIGRRHSIVSAGVVFFVGRVLMGIGDSYSVIQVGRVITNVGIGCAMTVTPVYIAELSPASSRGKLSSFPEVFFNAGAVFGHLCNYAFPRVQLDLEWSVVLELGAISMYVLAVGVLALPESPRWLIMKGRLGEGMRVLEMISDSNQEAALRYADIKKAAGIPEECDDYFFQGTPQNTGESMWTSSGFHLLLCAVGMHCFRQAAGIDTIVQDPRIFSKSGVTNPNRKLLATIAIDSIKTACMLFATFYLDRVGRLPLMLFSVGGMFVSLVCLGTFHTIVENNDLDLMLAVTIVLALLYAVFLFSGMAPITSMYSAEIFPLTLRTQGSAIGVAINLGVSQVSSSFFLWLCEKITFGGAVFLFATIAGIMLVWFYMKMPETMGLTLEEIGQLFRTYTNRRSRERGMEMQRINGVDGDATVSRPSSRALRC